MCDNMRWWVVEKEELEGIIKLRRRRFLRMFFTCKSYYATYRGRKGNNTHPHHHHQGVERVCGDGLVRLRNGQRWRLDLEFGGLFWKINDRKVVWKMYSFNYFQKCFVLYISLISKTNYLEIESEY